MTKTYVVTGATSGIGKELVELFSENGNTVFAGYRNKDKIPTDKKNGITYFYIDMTNDQSIDEAADFIKSKVNHIDTLINCAGCVEAGPIENINIDRLRRQFDINTFSHIKFTQNLLNILDNGKIINISSMASYGQFPFISPYCASKRALDIFFNALAIENRSNIKIISVKPGVISTPLWEKSVQSNIPYFPECKSYQKELEFLKINALKNSNRGLKVSQVVKLIKKIDESAKPKASYTIGIDAKLAQILAFFPQSWINKLVKLGLKYRVSKC